MTQQNTILTILQRAPLNLETGCWEWAGSKNPDGYGRFRFNGKLHSMHRLVYHFWNPDVSKELFVLHKCDNRKCCNPEHLFHGTNQDNMTDMVNKGRHRGYQKIDQKQIDEIIELRLLGIKREVLAEMFKVDKSTINRVTKHLSLPKILSTPRPVNVLQEGILTRFESVSAAARYLGVTTGAVCNAAKRGRKRKGFTVDYI